MRTRSAPLALAALALLAGGCAKKAQDTVEVVGVCSIPKDCTFQAGGCKEFLIGVPIVDTSIATSFQLPLDLRNQLTDNKSKDTNSTNTHDAQVHEASVEYEFVNAPASLGGSSAHTLGDVPAGTDSAVVVYLLPEEAMARLKTLPIPAFSGTSPTYWDVVAKVTLKGTYQDNSEFETGAYEVPFRVCNGCLTPCAGTVTCPPGADGQVPNICQ